MITVRQVRQPGTANMSIEFNDDGPGVKYYPADTLRETISPLLANLGYDWESVEGMTVSVDWIHAIPEEWFEGARQGAGRQEVKPDHLPDLLDYSNGKPWGQPPRGGSLSNPFEATVWLPGHIVVFSESYLMGEYVRCNVLPTKAPPAYRADLSGRTPRLK